MFLGTICQYGLVQYAAYAFAAIVTLKIRRAQNSNERTFGRVPFVGAGRVLLCGSTLKLSSN
jgi:hypothetical protein